MGNTDPGTTFQIIFSIVFNSNDFVTINLMILKCKAVNKHCVNKYWSYFLSTKGIFIQIFSLVKIEGFSSGHNGNLQCSENILSFLQGSFTMTFDSTKVQVW